MMILHFFKNVILEECLRWIGVLALTFICIKTCRIILKRVQSIRGSQILNNLVPSISNILYIVGLKVCIELAPVTGKLEIWLENSLYILSVIIFLNLFRKAALIGLEWNGWKSTGSKTLSLNFIPLLRNLTTLFIFLSGTMMILTHFHYDVMSLVTALGVGSLAVGLAAKDTLSNMISGFILIIDRNLNSGDRINLGGIVGDVQEIGLRSTSIKMNEGNTLIVPNSDLVNTKILNLSLPTREIIVTTLIRVSYSSPFPWIKNECLSILNEMNRIVTHHPITVDITSLSEGHQIIKIGFWISDIKDQSSVLSEFHEKILLKLQQQNILLLPPYSLPGLHEPSSKVI